MPHITVTREQGNLFESLPIPGFDEFIKYPVKGFPLQAGCSGESQICARRDPEGEQRSEKNSGAAANSPGQAFSNLIVRAYRQDWAVLRTTSDRQQKSRIPAEPVSDLCRCELVKSGRAGVTGQGPGSHNH